MAKLILVCLDTGKDITPTGTDSTLTIKRNVMKGEKFPFGKLIAPTPENPKGYVRSKPIGMGWRDLYPEVFNAKIEEVE